VKTKKKNTGTIAFRFRQVLLYYMLCITETLVLQYFNVNSDKIIVEILYKLRNNILKSKLTLNNLSICLSVCLFL